MRKRLEEFSLSLHPDKTRLIEFGRHAADRRAQRGLEKPETFKFLGFVFICGRSRTGKFLLKRKTRRDRMRTKLKEIKEELRRRMHQPIPEQGRWLAQVVEGILRVSCRADQLLGTQCIPPPHQAPLDAHAAASQPKGSHDVGADQEDRLGLSSTAENPTSVATAAIRRHPPKVGAACGNSARAVLCGGRSVATVPTANEHRRSTRRSRVCTDRRHS